LSKIVHRLAKTNISSIVIPHYNIGPFDGPLVFRMALHDLHRYAT